MTLRETIAALRDLEKVATPIPIRVEVSHDLWVELAAGYGIERRMVADCLKRPDAELFTAMRNALPGLLDALEGCEKALLPFSTIDKNTPSDLWAINSSYCEAARTALAALDKEAT